jgi:polysaccharide deacetylase family sporulation protein PdaB
MVNTNTKVIALTFDDGTDEERLKEILDILIENDVKATFFLIGSEAKTYPKLIKCLIANGNIIGNHSYSHPAFTKLSPFEMKKEINRADAVIKKITGQSTKPFFRPPYGDYNSTVLQVVGNAGYSKTITWTIDTLDWQGLSADEITHTVLSKAKPGSIVLMHAGSGAVNTPAALPDIIEGLCEMGYQFVTIPELLDCVPSEDESEYKDGKINNDLENNDNQTNKDLENNNDQANKDPENNNDQANKDPENSEGKKNKNELVNNDDQKIKADQKNTDKKGITYNITDIKGQNDHYIVKSGDTLTKISRMFGVTIQQIVSANNIKNPNLIYANQVLTIPDSKSVSTID